MTLFGKDEITVRKPAKYGSQFDAEQVKAIAVRVYGPVAEGWSRDKAERMLEAHDIVRKHGGIW
jgi:hypothetical protein